MELGLLNNINSNPYGNPTYGDWSGETIIGISNDNINPGDIIVMDGTAGGGATLGIWYLSDAMSWMTTPARSTNMLGLALNSASPGQNIQILMKGWYTLNDCPNQNTMSGSNVANAGLPLYLDTYGTPNQGLSNLDAPIGGNKYVQRIIGYLMQPDWPVIRFDPDQIWIVS
jgi:hypothetical protein